MFLSISFKPSIKRFLNASFKILAISNSKNNPEKAIKRQGVEYSRFVKSICILFLSVFQFNKNFLANADFFSLVLKFSQSVLPKCFLICA